jgi:Spy/CpxP family protein refolding chaperone
VKKTLLILALAAAVAGPLVAQGPPPQGPGGPPNPGGPQAGPPPDRVLVEVLGFGEAQLAQFRQLAEARRTAAEALQKQVAEAEKALGEALKAEAPDAAAVGAALLKVETLRKQFASIEEAFRTGVAGILTAEQKTKLEELRALAAAVRAGEALRHTGLL